MKRLSTHPSKLSIWLTLGLGLSGLTTAIGLTQFGGHEALVGNHNLWLSISLALSALAIIDYLIARDLPPIAISRKLPSSIAVNRWTAMELTISHRYRRRHTIELCDLYSNTIQFSQARHRIDLEPDRLTFKLQYQVRAVQRGEQIFTGVQLKTSSRFSLWHSIYELPTQTRIKVYPDFTAVAGYALLTNDNHSRQFGFRHKPRRGQGMDFLQLREYRSGDSARQIDWKATSRRQQLISKEYHDERDQQIIIMLDSGRRMRAKDAELSHFDHALNATLLLSYLALRQGDTVAVLCFGHTNRWIPGIKGTRNINSVLNQLYDLHSGIETADFLIAAQDLVARQRKRSLVILITNSHDDELQELLAAIYLLRRHHLVVLANLREPALKQSLHKPVQNLDDALTYYAVNHYLLSHRKTTKQFDASGVYNVDCIPQQLAAKVANRYLEIKRSRIL